MKSIFLAAMFVAIPMMVSGAEQSDARKDATNAKLKDWTDCVLDESPVVAPGSVESVVEKALGRCQWREDAFEQAALEQNYPETPDINQAPGSFKELLANQRKNMKDI